MRGVAHTVCALYAAEIEAVIAKVLDVLDREVADDFPLRICRFRDVSHDTRVVFNAARDDSVECVEVCDENDKNTPDSKAAKNMFHIHHRRLELGS